MISPEEYFLARRFCSMSSIGKITDYGLHEYGTAGL